ncbi:distal tail protein Dit [Gracilibacillus salinarum]|uniref:Phage tail family protein n=1 Tax=Gracilibacillus salinarum TaxID=2932255 RepID=A0ABY4GPQ1_9BACI|nr:distal tail protein Dit [Gracilibacillus salinarum]UOQ85697.1 phage tail family protein [Gracilibacillus salinarum]
MAYESITFNGIRKDWLYIERGRSKPPFAARKRNLLTVPGYPGGYLASTDIDPLPISQPVGFRIKDDADALTKKDELAEWLLTDKPVPLKFDDEPGRIYYAVVQNTLDDFEKMAVLRRGTIQFICPDPYAYGPEKPFSATSDYFNIKNEGTAEAEPVFEFEVTAPITFLMIQNQLGEYNMVGKPIDLTKQEPVQEYERLIYNPMNSVTGFTTATRVENSYIQGVMDANGAMIATDFGVERSSEFYGPAVKTSVSEVLSDFMVDMLVTFDNGNSPGQVGKVELYLYDELENVIAKLAMQDAWAHRSMTNGIIRIGDQTVNNYMIDENNAYWNSFYGILRILRKGDYWEAYIAELDENRKHHTRKFTSFKDNEGLFTDKQLAQVGIHIARWGAADEVRTFVHHLSVSKINSLGNNGVPYIADVGDIITFDHTNNGQVYINGEPYEDSILGADYFTLKKGDNNLLVMPGSLKTSGSYRERYL